MSTTTAVRLFDDDVPQIVMNNDRPRAKKSHPVTSHIAADVSARSMKATKLAVLQIVQQEARIVGSEINDLYRLRAARHGWGRIAFDTPRKRAGELAEDGFLEVAEYRTAEGNNLPEAEYRITDKGRDALRKEAEK